ncbi:AP-1 complex subunit beta-1 AltName: Full=Adaptor protein complex AP-1 subunit beta-1; AltName: Full=Adaptor-related protein complex 1 subunit beta-1; AltName: Full=Beta-1-adaptin; AltName: Full=Beta-adaptin 1; AltName: Full=Clathrin assembly protein complex 1 beta large chain; AltName: Full=Golgi adaptor HA1/AP1 adaptin beta subunit [Serendipita indica DSM 11827]|nr:AP-1 complex subunit beta-1 AltName: Full=Adaptor protein complex AP-1 subunit beta-1; AltName: Full=Adaptor-related protein complex 1 subunit beta-1; AltName: Full=Beta-1-adaptin; AltName: Full=Beta-adaptin 1; AltName: Full=Clathrin assembly protein complex 1 beta large chain; AltName: Full=Golgi adaptor HA1/AP1 adaptin beta subunit [Serendipita indica DSM 11827]
MAATGNDAKFFTRGKIQEFKAELQDAARGKDKKFAKRKTVLKKIVANITMGNDMSQMFPEVIQCLPIPMLEIKKMVYLFLVSYGRARPDLIERAIPHFQADCEDRNPLIRALAVRTMAYIPLPSVATALIEPLRHSLKDGDPYVRKTAAICVAKLYLMDHRIVEREKFIDQLKELLKDVNSTVVSNAVAALTEIAERSDNIVLKFSYSMATKLVAALENCSEWGQIYILDSLLNYVPQSADEANTLTERIVSRLQHSNSAVVLTVIKILLYLMNYIESKQSIEYLCKKMGPPLVTLLSSGPEVQYVALRNILLIIQRRPSVLKDDVKVFFCKYNDPIYVKLAKLEIIYRLATEANAKVVLAELHEYATEVDIDFTRKAVRSIGRLAIKISTAGDPCIKVLLELIDSKVSYVLQEAVVVIKDILRRYPDKYLHVIPLLCEHINLLDEPEAKAAIVWIIGQYADRIENADELMDNLTYTFLEEATEVQLALLTACVKLFIQKPQQGQKLLPKILKWATEEVDNPDLRDRGFMYWRLLSTDATAARTIVLGDRPPVNTDTDRMELGALDQLLLHTATLGSIYHKTPDTFIRFAKPKSLPDSPALNPASKRALISPTAVGPPKPVSTAHLVPPIPQSLRTMQDEARTTPQTSSPVSLQGPPGVAEQPITSPVSPSAASLQTPSRQGTTDSDQLQQQRPIPPPKPDDPYANLDSVFGNYVADQPRPVGGRPGEFDDLLL